MKSIMVLAGAIATACFSGCDSAENYARYIKDGDMSVERADKRVQSGVEPFSSDYGQAALEYDSAVFSYEVAAREGNGEAFLKMCDAKVKKCMLLVPSDVDHAIETYDRWVADARDSLSKAKDYLSKAISAGCANGVERSQKSIAEASDLIEDITRCCSPEHCILNHIALPRAAFLEVVGAVNYKSKTGNAIFDEQKNKEQWNRFKGRRIRFRGEITKVETTAFTDEVKVIFGVFGKSVSARFDGMSKSDGAKLSRGSECLVEGEVSSRPVLSSMALDKCKFLK